jgi:hypothetical protein
MLKTLNSDQVHFIALLAQTARAQRDELLGNVAERDLSESKAARGEHNPTAELGFEHAAVEPSPIAMLRDAIATLSPAGRAELFALMRLGQGDLAAPKWHHGIADAATLGDETITSLLSEDVDLHDHLLKGLYEVKLAS